MLKRLIEWLMSLSSPRFKFYRRARLSYEAYLATIRTPFHLLSHEQHRQAGAAACLNRAEQDYREAIRLTREDRDIRNLTSVLYQLGMLLHLQGRFDDAELQLRESLDLVTNMAQLEDDQQETASGCHYHLGVIAIMQGRLEDAKRELQASIRIDTVLLDYNGLAIDREALEHCDRLVGEKRNG